MPRSAYQVEPLMADALGATSAPRETRRTVIVALVAVWAIVLVDLPWIWGVVMILLGVKDIAQAQTQFVSSISRHHDPGLYWLVVGSWLIMGVVWLGVL